MKFCHPKPRDQTELIQKSFLKLVLEPAVNTKVYSIKSHKTKSIEILISSILNLKNVDSKGTQNGLSPELQTLKNMKN